MSLTVSRAATWAAGWASALCLFLTDTKAMSSLRMPYAAMYRCCSSEKIHSRLGPSGRSMMWSKMVRNAPCGWGWQLLIFSSATTSTRSNTPEATIIQPLMMLNTPDPPPT